MSVHGSHFRNDSRNSKQIKSKNFSKRELLHNSELSATSGGWVNSNSKVNFGSQSEGKIPHEIEGWRRAVREDKSAIRELQNLTGGVANLLYRSKSLDELIENSYFTLVQFDIKGDLISFTAYDSYPNLPFNSFWMDWLSENYKIRGLNPGNAFFVHYMVWRPEHEDKFLPLLLETCFTEFLHLKQIIIIQPPQTDIPEFYKRYFIPIYPVGVDVLETSSVQLIRTCLRPSIIPPLFIRTAFENDFEIILPVVRSNTKKALKVDSTDFTYYYNFLFQKDKKTLICECNGQVAGVMTLNLNIDLDILNEGFELGPFNCFRKKTMENDVSTPELPLKNLKPSESNSMLMSTNLFLSWGNWDLSMNQNESISTRTGSLASSTDNFSFYDFSSLIDLKKINETPQISASQAKSEVVFRLAGEPSVTIRPSEMLTTYFFPPKYSGQSNAFLIDFFAIDSDSIDEKLSFFDFLKAAFEIIPDREYCFILTPTSFLQYKFLELLVVSQNIFNQFSKRFCVRISADVKLTVNKENDNLGFFQSLPLNFMKMEKLMIQHSSFEICCNLKFSMRAPPKHMSCFKQELYLCHRNSFSVVSMHVRSTEQDDLEGIENFLKNVNDGDAVYRDILECFEENNELKSFVITFENTIIGVSLISSEDFDEHFRTYFEIPASQFSQLRRPSNSSVIKHLVISPVFNNHARCFIRDLMSLIDVTYLYYVGNSCKNHKNLLTVGGEFAPVKPKEKVEMNNFSIFYGKETHDCHSNISLRILYPRLCGFHRIHLNLVLVVVGASRTSKSFLESLIFGPEGCYYNFNNIICVSPRGLDVDEVEDNVKTFMFAHTDNFSKNYISMLSLSSYVNCIHGYVTQINRSEKFIVVNNKSTLRYDYLVLTCGLQYLSPVPEAHVKVKPKKTCKRVLKRLFSNSEEDPEHISPRNLHNMFIINTTRDAQYAINGVQFLVDKLKLDGRKIIVYGHDLHAFLTINTLLKLGIPGESIAFVEPFPTKNSKVALFNDPNVDKAVIELLKKCNVNYYTEYFLYDWSVSAEDYITAIKFHSSCNQLVIPCLAFFSFLEKLVSDVTFNACRDAGLVYDGRLVINHNFRTNDKYIYAAGPFTKYARRYYANEFNHQYYDSREVGQKLAAILSGKLNPLVEDETEETSDLVPRLETPIFYYCQLPGELNLFIIKKPGKEVNLETAINLHDYGEVLTTGDLKKSNTNYNYFRLHLDPQGFVASITCFSRNKIDYLNLYCLYGLHERMLNNLLMHFDLAMIPDFFEYFRQPWTAAIYHNNFQYLRQKNYETFFQKITDTKTFYELVVDELEEANWSKLNDSSNELVEMEYQYSNIHDDVKNNLIDFLEVFKDDLPEYATPSKVEKLLKRKILSLTFGKLHRDDNYLQSDTILRSTHNLRRKSSLDMDYLGSDSTKFSRTTFTL